MLPIRRPAHHDYGARPRCACRASHSDRTTRRGQYASISILHVSPRDHPSKSPKGKSLTPANSGGRRPRPSVLRIARGLPPLARVHCRGAGRREASIDRMHIENSCEHFKAELGKNRKVLRPNLGAVDNSSRRKKRVSEMQVNGIAQSPSSPGRGAFVSHPTSLTAFPSHERC
jgi:hypothetical protein